MNATSSNSKDKGNKYISQEKIHEEELAGIRSLRAMLTSLNEAAIKIHEDISTSIENQKTIQGKFTPEIKYI